MMPGVIKQILYLSLSGYTSVDSFLGLSRGQNLDLNTIPRLG